MFPLQIVAEAGVIDNADGTGLTVTDVGVDVVEQPLEVTVQV
jgi:hypothetical protein